ncbi:MAG: ATP-grasp domain-containing protein [Planctomycetes bacterium]|nr:ATP-grasp domain-containing protein [Planctomycetota bacterium]
MASDKPRILVAGVGGASLGTEVIKCLRLAGRYDIVGCDISPLAFGLFEPGVEAALVRREHYIEDVLALCKQHRIRAIVPGGEQPMSLLSEASDAFGAIGVPIAVNDPRVVAVCSDKSRCFDELARLNIAMPRTVSFDDAADLSKLADVPMPCVVKPATGSGGSRFVFLAADRAEAELYLQYIIRHAGRALAQEYIPLDEGEFTIGVLSLPSGQVVSVVSMKRLFHTKLSVSVATDFGLISSGYSQGLIDHFPQLEADARRLAESLGSTGPMNIQARVRGGRLIAFEINPRFSASTYLRACAGVNEIDLYLRHILDGASPTPPAITPGYYLRSLTETFTADGHAP